MLPLQPRQENPGARERRYDEYDGHKADHEQLLDELRDLMDDDHRMGSAIQRRMASVYFNRYVETMRKLQSINKKINDSLAARFCTFDDIAQLLRRDSSARNAAASATMITETKKNTSRRSITPRAMLWKW